MAKTRPQALESELKIDHTRGRDFFDPSTSNKRVTIVGCGGIGSLTAVLLSKMGIPYLTLIDPDVIEAHNLPNQFFPLGTCGKSKVNVLSAVCKMFGSSEVKGIQQKVQDAPSLLNGTVLTGLDSMSARKDVWELVKNNPSVDYLVDARVGGTDVVIYCVRVTDPVDQEQYENWALFSDEEGVEAPCTAQQIADVCGWVAGANSTFIRQIAAGKEPKFMTALTVEEFDTWVVEKPKEKRLSSSEDILNPTDLSSSAATEDSLST